MNAVAIAPPEIETLLPLTADEARRLRECEKQIQQGLETFYEVGKALSEIRDSRLYRTTHATFEDYCHDKWRMVDSRARQLIGASRVIDNLQTVTIVTPTTESQARELAPLEPEIQRAVWQIALRTAPQNSKGNPTVTAGHIKSVATVLADVVASGGLDDGSGEIKPLGVLIDAAVTEETYERMMRQKEYIKESLGRKSKPRADKYHIGTNDSSEPVLSSKAREFLDDYMSAQAEWAGKIPTDLSEFEREALENMIYEQGADALQLKNRTLESDCDSILKIMKETEEASHTGEMAVDDLYGWLLKTRYFMGKWECYERLKYMSRDDVHKALLTDAGEGKQEDRRGKLPGIVCVPWRKVWNQKAKAERDEDEDDTV